MRSQGAAAATQAAARPLHGHGAQGPDVRLTLHTLHTLHTAHTLHTLHTLHTELNDPMCARLRSRLRPACRMVCLRRIPVPPRVLGSVRCWPVHGPQARPRAWRVSPIWPATCHDWQVRPSHDRLLSLPLPQQPHARGGAQREDLEFGAPGGAHLHAAPLLPDDHRAPRLAPREHAPAQVQGITSLGAAGAAGPDPPRAPAPLGRPTPPHVPLPHVPPLHAPPHVPPHVPPAHSPPALHVATGPPRGRRSTGSARV